MSLSERALSSPFDPLASATTPKDTMPLSNAKEIWQTALGELQLQVTRPYYETYLHNTIGLDNDDGRFVIGVPTSFGVEWLNLRMRTRVEETLRGILKRPVSAQFVVCQNPKAHGRESQVDVHPGSHPNTKGTSTLKALLMLPALWNPVLHF